MPQIIVVADADTDRQEAAVTLRERINQSDFESRQFGTHLLERLNWAVEDAHAAEVNPPRAS